MGKVKSPRSTALLEALDVSRILVKRIEMSFEAYYDEPHASVDSSEYRAAHGIRILTGRLYDSRGVLVQDFENHYDSNGAITRSRTVHDDGSVDEHSFNPQ